jgi:hypothetical protein
MRMVNLQEFLTLPTRTVFSFLEPQSSQGLYRFEEPVRDDDFLYSTLTGEELTDDHDNRNDEMGADSAADIAIAVRVRRWGRYDQSQLFLIYSRTDVLELIAELVQSADNPEELVQWTYDANKIMGYWARPGEEFDEAEGNAIQLPIDTVLENTITGDRYRRQVYQYRPGYAMINLNPDKRDRALIHGEVYRIR